MDSHDEGVALYRALVATVAADVDFFIAETLSSTQEMRMAVEGCSAA